VPPRCLQMHPRCRQKLPDASQMLPCPRHVKQHR
jgi:hypothetical protein